jgi:hypothetical protein
MVLKTLGSCTVIAGATVGAALLMGVPVCAVGRGAYGWMLLGTAGGDLCRAAAQQDEAELYFACTNPAIGQVMVLGQG